jgi:hypothetical protein
MSLRKTLSKAVASRNRLIQLGKGRDDWQELRTALALCEQFLVSYPAASDERVINWCREHHRYVWKITTSKNRRIYNELLGYNEPDILQA